MESSNTILLELSQQLGTTFGPGDYSVSIPPGVAINEGDQVIVNKVFVDNAAESSQKISIEDDISLDIGVGYYYQNTRTNNQDNSIGGQAGYAANPYFDCKTYVLCQKIAASGFNLPGIFMQTNQGRYEMDPNDPNNPSSNDENNYVQIFITLQYTAPSGEVKQTTIDCSKFVWQTNDNSQSFQSGEIDAIIYDKTKPVEFKAFQVGTMRFNGPVQAGSVLAQFYNNNTKTTFQFKDARGNLFKQDWTFVPDPATSTLAAPVSTQTLTRNASGVGVDIVVPKGTYTPQDLAAIVNDQLQQNYASGGSLLSSPFLIQYTPNRYPDTVFVAEREPNGTVVAAFEIAPGLSDDDALLIGATQMELTYDPDRQTFFWAYVHSPYFGFSVPGVESVGFLETVGLVAGKKREVVTRNSGIFFTELSAKNANGDQVPFWDKYLGFDLTKLVVPNGASTTDAINSFNPGNLLIPDALPVGVCTTAGYFANSSLADLTQSNVYWRMPVIDPVNGYFSNSTGQTVPIFASRADIAADNDSTGYYLISVDGKTGGDYRGVDGYRSSSIGAIVSKYYAAGSFTTGTNSDAIPYTHSGPSIVLDSWRVRILAPDKTIAQDLGNRSAVILQVVRAPPPSLPPAGPKS